MQLTTKVQDQPRGTTAAYSTLSPRPDLAKTIHEQLLAAVLLDSMPATDGIYLVTTEVSVKVYAKVFDQPLTDSPASKDNHP